MAKYIFPDEVSSSTKSKYIFPDEANTSSVSRPKEDTLKKVVDDGMSDWEAALIGAAESAVPTGVGVGGMGIGATVGSPFFPPFGTVVGAAIGGIGSSLLASTAQDAVTPEFIKKLE